MENSDESKNAMQSSPLRQYPHTGIDDFSLRNPASEKSAKCCPIGMKPRAIERRPIGLIIALVSKKKRSSFEARRFLSC
jgi:hypothetical protein